MKSSNPSSGQNLSVERLGRKLYEESGAAGAKPWVRLGWDTREIWLAKAREALDPSRSSERSHFGRFVRLFS